MVVCLADTSVPDWRGYCNPRRELSSAGPCAGVHLDVAVPVAHLDHVFVDDDLHSFGQGGDAGDGVVVASGTLADVRATVGVDNSELHDVDIYDISNPKNPKPVKEYDLLDLEPLLRDAVVLSLPFQPLCRDDCPGLCIECGARLADDPGHQHEEPIDPRWAALQGLTQTDDESRTSSGEPEE